VVYILATILLIVGLFGVFTQKNLIKIIISVSIIESAVNVFLILVGYRSGGIAPLMTEQHSQAEVFALHSVDPLPQAMILTSIVISLSILALMVAISLRLYHVYGTYDITEIRKARLNSKS